MNKGPEDRLAKGIEYLFLALTWLSCLACLVRTDYNFAFALFCYYMFISRKENKDMDNTLNLIIINFVLAVIDVLWLISIGSVWTSKSENNDTWNKLYNLHLFVIFVSVISTILKIVIIILLSMYRKSQAEEMKRPLRTEEERRNPSDAIRPT